MMMPSKTSIYIVNLNHILDLGVSLRLKYLFSPSSVITQRYMHIVAHIFKTLP